MSRETAKQYYQRLPGDPDQGWVTPDRAMGSIDVVYDDMSSGLGGGGDVIGPDTSVQTSVVRFADATGKLVGGSSALLSDDGMFVAKSYRTTPSGGSTMVGPIDDTGTVTGVVFSEGLSQRWRMYKSSDPELGGGVGSGFRLDALDDNGATSGVVFSAERSDGSATFHHDLNVRGDLGVIGSIVAGGLSVTSVGGLSECVVGLDADDRQWVGTRYRSGGRDRWLVGKDTVPEDGGDVGSRLVFRAYGDAGLVGVDVLVLDRASHHATFAGPVVVGGMLSAGSAVISGGMAISGVLRGVVDGVDPLDAVNKRQLDAAGGGGGGGGGGDVSGPASSTVGAVTIWDDVSGKFLESSGLSVGSNGVLTGVPDGVAPLDAVNRRQLDAAGGGGSGSVSGPTSSTVGAVPTWSDATGTTLDSSGVAVTSSGGLLVTGGVVVAGGVDAESVTVNTLAAGDSGLVRVTSPLEVEEQVKFDSLVEVDSAAGSTAVLFALGNKSRWQLRSNVTNGAFSVDRFTEAGVLVDSPLIIDGTAGKVIITGDMAVNYLTAAYGMDAGGYKVTGMGEGTAPSDAATVSQLAGIAPWIGTQQQYDALGSYDPARLYAVTA